MSAHVAGTSFTGDLIVVEGLDGCGKTDFTQLFLQWCKLLNLLVKEIPFPRYDTPPGRRVKDYLTGAMGNVDPWRAAWLYALDRRAARKYMRNLFRMGYLVLANRYDISNAFQAARFADPTMRKLFVSLVSTLERGIFRIPKPNLVIYLKMPAEVAFALKQAQRIAAGEVPDIHEADLPYQKRVESVYDELFDASRGDWLRIPCMDGDRLRSPEEIFEIARNSPKLFLPVLKLVVKGLLLKAGDKGLSGREIKASFPEWFRVYVTFLTLPDLCLEGEVTYDQTNQTYYLGKGKGR